MMKVYVVVNAVYIVVIVCWDKAGTKQVQVLGILQNSKNLVFY